MRLREWLVLVASTSAVVGACSAQGGQCLDANGYPLNPQPDLPGCRFSSTGNPGGSGADNGFGGTSVGNAGTTSAAGTSAGGTGFAGGSNTGGAAGGSFGGAVGIGEGGLGGEGPSVPEAGAGGAEAGAAGALH